MLGLGLGGESFAPPPPRPRTNILYTIRKNLLLVESGEASRPTKILPLRVLPGHEILSGWVWAGKEAPLPRPPTRKFLMSPGNVRIEPGQLVRNFLIDTLVMCVGGSEAPSPHHTEPFMYQ